MITEKMYITLHANNEFTMGDISKIANALYPCSFEMTIICGAKNEKVLIKSETQQ